MGANRSVTGRAWRGLMTGCLTAFLSVIASQAAASEVFLKDGRILRGKVSDTFGLAESNNVTDPTGSSKKTIIFVDDDLRRTYVSLQQILKINSDTTAQAEEKFQCKQPSPHGANKVMNVGPPAKPLPDWDEFGRRIFTMQTARGTLDVIQAMTEITPHWIKVEGMNFVWDMRIATTTVPAAMLKKILYHQINPKNVEHREKIARFYLQCERYDEARRELEGIITDFGNDTETQQRLRPIVGQLTQLQSQKLLTELKLRAAGGQYKLVQAALKQYLDREKDISGEFLQMARQILEQQKDIESFRTKVLAAYLAEEKNVTDNARQQVLGLIGKELREELDVDTLPRMAAFMQNVAAPQTASDAKLALAASGWLLGADEAVPDLSLALSAYKVRERVRGYLAEPLKLRRNRIRDGLPSEVAATPALIAAIVARMKPPGELPEPIDEKSPGFYKIEVNVMAKLPPINYYVQLPPEYNPLRRYPMIVALHGFAYSAEQEIDWWAGERSDRGRLGQAGRHGFIVVSPEWSLDSQRHYDYSSREHAAVLNCTRDACRRFAVDTDRVFLAGHSMGGDAAWDIGLAHPDMWAGVVPVAADAQKFCTYYWVNAKNLPFYVIQGELDGDRMRRNALSLDRYLQRGYNTTVVEYLGRGHEDFIDEQLRLFEWMAHLRRDFFPREFACVTMRPWDNYFWWAEVNGLPPAADVDPATWPPRRGAQPATIKGQMKENNVNLSAGTKAITIWLSPHPQFIDFSRPMSIWVNGRHLNTGGPLIKPSVETLLEDVRTRGDRQHPFWAKVDVPSGKN